MHGFVTHSKIPTRTYEHRFLRVCADAVTSEPQMTLYEVDVTGWVHRLAQLHHTRTRFSPEDVLLCASLDVDAMLTDESVEEISRTEFDLLWAEIRDERPFLAQVPDPRVPWQGHVWVGDRWMTLQWRPDRIAPADWTLVPGFSRLFLEAGGRPRGACGAILADAKIDWKPGVLVLPASQPSAGLSTATEPGRRAA